MKRLLLGVIIGLAACSGHGSGIPCIETMPGMQMCPTVTVEVIPDIKVVK